MTDRGLPVAVVSAPDGQQTEVQLRSADPQQQQQRYRRKGSRASYRWSGQEMYQVDGPPACNNDNGEAENGKTGSQGHDSPAEQAKDNMEDVAAAEQRLAAQQAQCGLRASQPAATDSDSCFKALIDQMTQPHQDFPAWDRDDHTFLRWYICKQLEILASSGRGPDYIQGGDIDATLATFQGEETFVGDALIFSFARLFKKDVVLLSGDPAAPLRYFKGGKGGQSYGRGQPLLLGQLLGPESGQKVFTSLVPDENTDMEALICQLRAEAC